MFGQSWLPTGVAALPRNAFKATLTGARAVRLDVDAMKLDARRELSGEVDTEAALVLELSGRWPASLTATIDGASVAIERSGNVVRLTVPAGKHGVELRPAL